MNTIKPQARTCVRRLLVGMVLLLAGCSGTTTRSDGPRVGPIDAGTARLLVDNQSTAQIRIFALSSGQRVRLGTVNGLSTETLTIPDFLVGGGRNIAFVTEPLAGQASARTIELYVTPGDAVRLIIPSQIR